MATKNKRVATYLPPAVYDKLQGFKTERNIEGDSQALIVILSEFLEVSQQVSHQVDSELMQRIETLENRLMTLKDELLGELNSRLLLVNVQTQPTNSSNGELLNKEAVPAEASELPSIPIGEPLKHDSQSDVSLEGKRRRGRPKAVGIPVDGMLSTSELARRLGVSSSTLSHWKPGGAREKSLEEMLKVTRKEDPEGIGWMYVPEVNHFRPEREISSSSPEVLQSELLETKEV